MANEVVVPVGVQLELKNVQDVINGLQTAMSKVKPDTKGYDTIVKELKTAEQHATSLASRLKQGFTNQSGLKGFEKQFENLVALVDTINTQVAGVKFDNLILSQDQTDQIRDFAQAIADAKANFSAFETDKIKDAVSVTQELQQAFANLKINVDTTTLDDSIAKIRTRLNELQNEIQKQEAQAAKYETRAANRQSEMDQLTSLKGVFAPGANTSGVYKQFFDSQGRFKNTGRKDLEEWMKELGLLDQETADKIKQLSASRLSNIQQEMNKKIDAAWKRKDKSRGDASQDAAQIRKDLIPLQQEAAQLTAASGKLEGISQTQEYADAIQQLGDSVRMTTTDMERFKAAETEAAKGDFGGTAASMQVLEQATNNAREGISRASAELDILNQKTRTMDSVKRAVSMWMGFNQVIRLTKTAIRNIINDIRELDKVMTQIAVVTNMSQADLWKQMGTYQNIAKSYGVSTSGVYQVSQIYYQQGLQTAQVMQMTNETLKMAKIAGLDYAAAADYMTVAVRGFHMEMSEAQNVVDVYSNLAAKSAVDTTELATAMSKTASSASAVGSSFESTSAMIAMMVETTRESAENIGSAMKSIISRYGELKSDPGKLIDSEGEELSLNKVDTALKSVGITIQDAKHQFRDFDDVIMELASKWDTLDKNSQRYYKIA